MSPPPVTPSPRRFILNKPRASQQKTAFSNTQTQSHFNTTPRFSVGPLRQTPSLTQTPAPSRRFEEIIFDDESSDLDPDVRESIETADRIADPDGQWIEAGNGGLEEEEDDYDYGFLDRDVKRRRVESTDLERQDAEMLEVQHEAVNAVTTGINEQDHEREEDFDDLLSSQPALPIFSSPQRPIKDVPSHRPSTSASSTHNNPTPRFIVPSTPSAATPLPPSRHLHPQHPSSTPATVRTAAPDTTTASGPFHKPPRFLPLSDQNASSPNQAHDPLPEAFSPHRRGQKFLAGGLASEVRGWIMGLESSSGSSSALPNSIVNLRSRSGDGKMEEWLFKLVVEEVTGGSGTGAGMTLVRGRMAMSVGSSSTGSGHARDIKMILAGEGTAEGVQRPKRAVVGSTVGIKGPVWEVIIQGERWGVAVEWKAIS